MSKIFILKQHTPMLHFQASQYGATLRASDVKPRLDRWLIDTLGGDDNSKFENCQKYLIGYPGNPNEPGLSDKERSGRNSTISALRNKFISDGFRALNYKMRIAPAEPKEYIQNPNVSPMYFGRGASQVKYPKIELCFTATDTSFLDEILTEDKLNTFFNTHNFGTRASKGYGSFMIENLEEHNIEGLKRQYYYFNVPEQEYKSLFANIELLYKAMRSGINDDDMYFKSFMYAYSQDNEKFWDKRVIKDYFLAGSVDGIKDEKLDFRDCLGFSSYQDWGYYGISMSRRFSVRRGSADVYGQRYSSPIMFKPIKYESEWYVFIIPQETDSRYYAAKVIITLNSKKDKKDSAKNQEYRDLRKKYIKSNFLDSNGDVKIDAPKLEIEMKKDFSVNQYLDFIFGPECADVMKLFSKKHPVTGVEYDLNTERVHKLISIIENVRSHKLKSYE